MAAAAAPGLLSTVGLGELSRQIAPGGAGASRLGGLGGLLGGIIPGGLLSGTGLGLFAGGGDISRRLLGGQSPGDIFRSAERAFEPNKGLGIFARQIPGIGTGFQQADLASAEKKAQEARKKERERIIQQATLSARQALTAQGIRGPALASGIAKAAQDAVNQLDQSGLFGAQRNVQQLQQQLQQAQSRDAQLAQFGSTIFGLQNPGLFGSAATGGQGAQGAQAEAGAGLTNPQIELARLRALQRAGLFSGAGNQGLFSLFGGLGGF